MTTVRFNAFALVLAGFALVASTGWARGEEKVGKRPYEMDWAGRTEEVRTPVVDFENLDGWRVETTNASATFERSREEQMYGRYVGKLTYRRVDPKGAAPVVDVRPPAPIPFVEKDVDAYSMWIFGNNWGWTVDPKTPRVVVKALFADSTGKERELLLETVNWKEWFLSYRVVPQDLLSAVRDGGAFTGFRVTGGTNDEDRTLYFDSLCVFKEVRDPLSFSRRSKPGIDLFEGQPLGVNDGEGRLPFPTNEDTVIPDSSKNLVKPAFHFYGDGCDFVYEGTDGTLVYEYRPKTGNWSDVAAKWNDSAAFQPCSGGGVTKLVGASGAIEPVKDAELLKFESTSDGARVVWKLSSETSSAEVEYRLKLKGKSLVIDTLAKGGKVPETTFGVVAGLGSARVFTVPYYLYDYSKRPGIGMIETNDADPSTRATLFASANIDWYRSGASYLRGEHGTDDATATLNGGAEYRAKTDGTRNDVYERFVLTFSPKFEEVLPTIANPPSPYRELVGQLVWRANYGPSERESAKAYWRDVYRRGMRRLLVRDHEWAWSDGGESFTFRTKPAPGIGGDEGQYDFARFMRDELGYVYGTYNNFTDFAPVNEYWSPDLISRAPDWSLQRAWMRCYAPKPIRAVEFCEKLVPIIQEKFHFNCGYCDVHTSVPPWGRTDYDERVPGAGTFMSVYYPFGELLLLQRKGWEGPVFSEGPHHCFYAGLDDGNYGQDQPYNMFLNPWLVDFDLRKIHDLEVDFGMGNVVMFAPGYSPKNAEERSDLIDRFLAATLAFGHVGYFVTEYGWELAGRSYFMTQQIASYYTRTSADKIIYFDADGNGYETSEALKRDLVKRSQIGVVYKDGTTIFSNGSKTEGMRLKFVTQEVELPPNGYAAWSGDGKVLVESFLSRLGRRFDYCESPEYVWFDGRGTWEQRGRACGVGAAVCRTLENAGEYEIIPYNDKEVGFKLVNNGEVASAVALDKDFKEIGTTSVKVVRGFVFVDRVENAASYKVVVKRSEGASVASSDWKASKYVVAPGEKVVFSKGDARVEWTAPSDDATSAPKYVFRSFGLDGRSYWQPETSGVKHIWAEPSPGEYADVLVATPNLAAFRNDEVGKIFVRDVSATSAAKSKDEPANVEPPTPSREGEENVFARIGDRVYKLVCDAKKTFERYPNPFDDQKNPPKVWIQRRGQAPTPTIDGSGAVNGVGYATCGGVAKRGRRLHPAYQGGPMGFVATEYRLTVPECDSVVFRADVGKIDSSGNGDGILYKVLVKREGEEDWTTLAERLVAERAWFVIEADLAQYSGATIALALVADPNETTTSDHGACADLRLEKKTPILAREIKDVVLKNLGRETCRAGFDASLCPSLVARRRARRRRRIASRRS